MKKILMFALVLLLGVNCFAAGKDWMDDLDKAVKVAQKSGKLILVDFAGSDWCPACMMLEKEVFKTKEFKEFAKDNLVLVLIDFPKGDIISKKRRAVNEKLARKFKIQYFPTVYLLDSKGKTIAELDYNGDGPKNFIKLVKSKMPKKKSVGKK